MRLTSCAAHGGNVLASFFCAVLLAACGGGSNAPSQAPSTSDTPSAGAKLVSAEVDEGADVAAYIGKSAAITVRFSVSEGAVTALQLQAPATPGWQSADGKLACERVSAESPCTLRLLYAPKAFAASATLKLLYSYVDAAGRAGTGSLAVNYRTLPANSATVTLQPAGTLTAVVGTGGIVSASFNTSDGSAASALRIDLSSLPTGWSGDAALFECASFGGNNACQLQLRYQPSAGIAQTSFDLSYSYLNSAGNARSGKLTVAYAALMPNTVSAGITPAGKIVVIPGASQEVSLDFQSSDGNLASNLDLDAGASAALPEGWSVKTSTLPCQRVEANGSCKLLLTYAPKASLAPQQISFGYAYVDAAGQARQGTASLSYTSRIYRAYVADADDGSGSGSGGARQCEIDVDGTLQNCVRAESTWPTPGSSKVLVSGARAYVVANRPAASPTRALSLCAVEGDGALGKCVDAGLNQGGVTSLALLGQYLYLTAPGDGSTGGATGTVRCALDDSGAVQAGSCARVSLDSASAFAPAALTTFNAALYAAAVDTSANNSTTLLRCLPDFFGGIQLQCLTFPTDYAHAAQSLAGVTLTSGDYLYLLGADSGGGAIVKCQLAANGNVSGCDAGRVPSGVAADELAQAREISVINKRAYIAIAGGNRKGILRCAIDEARGNLQSCVVAGDTGSIAPVGIGSR
ncbi:hypothetical protein [Noviherbaspirillum pedocola]|uniref:Uncharacterized protein n=1 Tax=Noviherbaspirillum pedocola TaxID=2801341 RepID=A0A934W6M2_9BURK|nr:hypothetical protein [Noviherbaspirillum pedocola]MBK4733674.1 hypothetical protein [Noviherbaspirillum pedocola]